MSNSIKFPGVVFVKYVKASDGVCRVFVTNTAKNYDTQTLGMFNLNDNSIAFSKSTARVDTEKQLTGMFVESKGTKGSLLDQPDNGWQTFEFPLFNKIITKNPVSREDGATVYQVISAGMSDAEIRIAMSKFAEKYPNLVPAVTQRYNNKIKAGTYTPIQDRLAGANVQSNAFDISVPYTAESLINASARSLQTWCKAMGIPYPGSKDQAKRKLLELLA